MNKESKFGYCPPSVESWVVVIGAALCDLPIVPSPFHAGAFGSNVTLVTKSESRLWSLNAEKAWLVLDEMKLQLPCGLS